MPALIAAQVLRVLKPTGVIMPILAMYALFNVSLFNNGVLVLVFNVVILNYCLSL